MDKKIIPRPSLKEQVYNYLKKAILTGELEVGTFYSVQEIASELGVSRSPVREAVQQLQHDGIVDVFPYKGFIIKSVSRAEIDEVFEVREAIESFCIRKALAHYGTEIFDSLMKELEEIIEEQRKASQAGEPVQYWAVDKAFHSRLVDYSQNRILKQFYASIGDKISNIALAILKDRERFKTASLEHEVILDCLKKGEQEAILQNTIHLSNTKELVLNTLEGTDRKKR